jgi:hypothetical protein
MRHDEGMPPSLMMIDTEREVLKKAVEVHRLITEAIVANGKIHKPIHPRRIP